MDMCGFLNHGDPDNTGCIGVLAAIVIGDTVLIRVFSILWQLCPKKD